MYNARKVDTSDFDHLILTTNIVHCKGHSISSTFYALVKYIRGLTAAIAKTFPKGIFCGSVDIDACDDEIRYAYSTPTSHKFQ